MQQNNNFYSVSVFLWLFGGKLYITLDLISPDMTDHLDALSLIRLVVMNSSEKGDNFQRLKITRKT